MMGSLIVTALQYAQLKDSKVGEEVVLAVGNLRLEVLLHEAKVGRVIPVCREVVSSMIAWPRSGKERGEKGQRGDAPTPWMSSWMTSVRLSGVCHSLRAFAGTGEVEVAIVDAVGDVLGAVCSLGVV